MAVRREAEAIVPQITAEGRVAVPQYDTRIPTQDYRELDAVSRNLDRTSSTLTQIGAYYNELQKKTQILADKNESAVLNAQYTAQLNNAREQLQLDPNLNDPDAFSKAFLAKEKEIRTQTLGAASNGNVAALARQHADVTLPEQLVNARAQGIKKQIDYAKGSLDTIADLKSDEAATAATHEGVQAARSDFYARLNDNFDKGLINRQDYARRLASFDNTVFDKRAEHLLNVIPIEGLSGTDLFREAVNQGQFDGMDSKLLGEKFAKADKIDREREAAIVKAHNEVKAMVKTEWASKASLQQLSPQEIQEAIDNKNPYVDPDEARKYGEMNAYPFNPAADAAVFHMRDVYSRENITKERITDFQNRLSTLPPTKEVGVFARELQHDRQTAESIDTKAMGNAHKVVEGALDKIKKIPDPLMRMLGAMDRGENAEATKRVKAAMYDAWTAPGATPETVQEAGLREIEAIQKERAAELANIPEDKKRKNKLYKP